MGWALESQDSFNYLEISIQHTQLEWVDTKHGNDTISADAIALCCMLTLKF